MSEHPAQPSLRRLKAFGIRPVRDLGQNFLIDSNLLGVIARAAELGPDDVVLEVGGGLGVLSEYLAERAAHVHVVEVDRRLEPALRDATDPHANVTLHFADAVKLDLAALEPVPTKVIANLPYGVAASVILRTIELLPSVDTWVAMVQREVGERFAARPGSGAYGVPSVLAQLACEVRVLRPVSRRVFHPVPNVDSVLVGLRRRGPAPEPGLRALVQQGFAHRRKALPRSLALAAGRRRRCGTRARAALEALGHTARRARRGARARGVAGAVRGDARRERPARPRAGQGQPLPVRRRAARGRAAPARLGRAGAVARRRADARARRQARGRGRLPGRRGAEPRGARARALPRGDGLGRAAAAADDREADPGRGRDGRRLLRRRRDAAARRPRRRAGPCRPSSRRGSAPTSRACCAPAAC